MLREFGNAHGNGNPPQGFPGRLRQVHLAHPDAQLLGVRRYLFGGRFGKKDHEFLLHGGVFTEDVIETWVQYKRSEEVSAVRMRPHPYEFALYYDS